MRSTRAVSLTHRLKAGGRVREWDRTSDLEQKDDTDTALPAWAPGTTGEWGSPHSWAPTESPSSQGSTVQGIFLTQVTRNHRKKARTFRFSAKLQKLLSVPNKEHN